jgi:hypothetical protein
MPSFGDYGTLEFARLDVTSGILLIRQGAPRIQGLITKTHRSAEKHQKHIELCPSSVSHIEIRLPRKSPFCLPVSPADSPYIQLNVSSEPVEPELLPVS